MLKLLAGWTGSFSLLVLPGCWLAFGLPLGNVSFWSRAALAVVLSPAVVVAEFYTLRGLGVPFGGTAVALVLVNLPAGLLAARCWSGIAIPRARTVLIWLGPVVLAVAYLTAWLADGQVRASSFHNWLHADIIYLLANGQLRPEEPLLAGVELSYPWAAHVFQAVVSFIHGTPPSSSFVLTNAACLLAVLVFAAGVVRELGGRPVTQATAMALLCFGVNFLGPLAAAWLPEDLVRSYRIWGDVRYLPWLRKFGIFEATVFGIGHFAALAYLLVQAARRQEAVRASVVAVLLVSAAVLYPVLWPASAMVVGAYGLVRLTGLPRAPGVVRELSGLTGGLTAGAVTLAAHLRVVTVDRAGEAAVAWTTPYEVKVKLATLAIIMAPLWFGLLLSLPVLWRQRQSSIAMLAVTLTGVLGLYVAADIYYFANEYKFIFVAAFCLAPLAAITLGRVAERSGPIGLALPVVVAALLSSTAFQHLPFDRHAAETRPVVDLSAFDLRLAPGQPLAGPLDALRSATAPDTVVVSRLLPFDLATIARRALYVPFVGDQTLLGLSLTPDYLLAGSRGYARDRIRSRRALVGRLYEATDDADRRRTLDSIVREVERPVALVTDRSTDTALEAWLPAAGATLVYEDAEAALWIIGRPTSVR